VWSASSGSTFEVAAIVVMHLEKVYETCVSNPWTVARLQYACKALYFMLPLVLVNLNVPVRSDRRSDCHPQDPIRGLRAHFHRQ